MSLFYGYENAKDPPIVDMKDPTTEVDDISC